MIYDVESIDIYNNHYKRLHGMSSRSNANRREYYALAYGEINPDKMHANKCSLVVDGLKVFSDSNLESFSETHVNPNIQEVHRIINYALNKQKDFILEIHTHPQWSNANLSPSDIIRYQEIESFFRTEHIGLLIANAVLCGSDFRFRIWHNGKAYPIPYRRIKDLDVGKTGFESIRNLVNNIMEHEENKSISLLKNGE